MKITEFELNIDKDGRPMIKFRHHDKSNSLEQKILGIFIEAVKEKGMILINPSGSINTNGNSHENYEIHIKKQQS